jgi:hypothetical protein
VRERVRGLVSERVLGLVRVWKRACTRAGERVSKSETAGGNLYVWGEREDSASKRDIVSKGYIYIYIYIYI